jgi:hypothetical protein
MIIYNENEASCRKRDQTQIKLGKGKLGKGKLGKRWEKPLGLVLTQMLAVLYICTRSKQVRILETRQQKSKFSTSRTRGLLAYNP